MNHPGIHELDEPPKRQRELDRRRVDTYKDNGMRTDDKVDSTREKSTDF